MKAIYKEHAILQSAINKGVEMAKKKLKQANKHSDL